MDMYKAGLDKELENTEELDAAPAEKKPKRKPFHIWTVGGKDYKLKLTTKMIGALERKYRTNVLNLVTIDGLPSLSVMLTIIQAAASPWNHGMDYEKVEELYDQWNSEGGNQMDLLGEVIMPTMVVSGFFTEKQGNSIMAGLKETDSLL